MQRWVITSRTSVLGSLSKDVRLYARHEKSSVQIRSRPSVQHIVKGLSAVVCEIIDGESVRERNGEAMRAFFG